MAGGDNAKLDELFGDGNGSHAAQSSRRERRAVSRGAVPSRRPPRMRARKVHRLVRHIEPWSVLKISLVFFFCIWVILLTSAVLLWQVASSSGIIDNVESFIEEVFALEKDSFAFEAGQMFRAYAVGGLVMVVAATGFTVLLAVLFNLISDLTGGVRVTVVEEETARPVEPAPTPEHASNTSDRSAPRARAPR
ncbi:MAG TPA: DUF3566 domain-containing protein [Acidimicrobiales bacterium]